MARLHTPMDAPQPTITDYELRDAYRRAGLWRLGWTYQRAITTDSVRIALECTAEAARRRAEREGKPLPRQAALELDPEAKAAGREGDGHAA